MGFQIFESDCPVAAVEMAADYYDGKFDLTIVRGATITFGVRKLRSRKPFAFYKVSGRPIPIYELETISEQSIDPMYIAAFEDDYLKYVKKKATPPAQPLWLEYNEV